MNSERRTRRRSGVSVEYLRNYPSRGGVMNQKLTEAQVRTIMERLAHGRRGIGRVLAREFGVSESTISKIRHERRWGPTLTSRESSRA
jgi:predicted DNA binding protein